MTSKRAGDVYGYFDSFRSELRRVFNHCTAKFITNATEQKVILFAINLLKILRVFFNLFYFYFLVDKGYTVQFNVKQK